jgi:hypothetical protein
MILALTIGGCFLFLEPERCSLCSDLPRHAPCILNLSTGEKLELEIFEPHPFIVGEIADEQPGGYFCLIRDAGVSGYKIAAECIQITIPSQNDMLNPRHFCRTCRNRLANYRKSGFILADLINPKEPIIYPIHPSSSVSVRCYYITILENAQSNEYLLSIVGKFHE